jgi:hypothetical protein
LLPTTPSPPAPSELSSGGTRHRFAVRVGLYLMLTLVLAACSPPRGTPEQEIRDLLEAAEAAAEARDLDALTRWVSDDYTDEHGADRAALRNTLRLVLLRHRNIHLLSRIDRFDLPAPDQAQVGLLLAMASRPFPEDAPLALSADLYRLELRLRDEGDGQWRLVGADWGPAPPGQLFRAPGPS